MNKIDTIEAISDTIGSCSITITPKRCSYIRNWNSRCQQCMNACQHEAIKRSVGHLKIDSELCTDCGACCNACPTSTFATTAPDMNQIVSQAKLYARANGGEVAFVCQQHANEQHIDVEKALVLPCLNYLDEYLLTGLYAVGAERIVLLKGSCEGCEVDCAEPYFDVAVQSTKQMLELWKVPGRLEMLDEIPEKYLTKHKHAVASIGSDRREAFRQAGSSAMGFLAQAVNDIVDTATGKPAPKKEDPDKQIIVRLDEIFPPNTYRSVRMLTMLDHIGTRPRGKTIESRFWASVDIDPEKCRHCGMCSTLCVTRALEFIEHGDGKVSLLFHPQLCINCRMCKECCLTRSMVYSNKVLADDLDQGVVKTLLDHVPEQKINRPW